MKILHISNNYSPFAGGVVKSIDASVAGLRAKGHDVRIVTLQFLPDHSDDPEYVYRIPAPIRFKYKSNHMAVPWRPNAYIAQVINEFKPDVVHLHHPFLLGQIGLKIAKKVGIPAVFTYHTLYDRYVHYVPLPERLVVPWVMGTVKGFCRQVDVIIAPSSTVCQQIQRLGVHTPVSIVPSAIRDRFFMKHAEEGGGSRGRVFRLLYVGRFTKEKNIPFLLDLFARLLSKQKYSLTLAGYGNEWEWMRRYAYEELSLSPEQVHFVHKPGEKCLVKYYQQADLFLFPSTTDTQGLVLAESMACGTPVLAVPGPGQQDIVEQGKNGFILRTLSQFAEKIDEISQNKQINNALSEHARMTSSRYKVENHCDLLVRVYKEQIASLGD